MAKNYYEDLYEIHDHQGFCEACKSVVGEKLASFDGDVAKSLLEVSKKYYEGLAEGTVTADNFPSGSTEDLKTDWRKNVSELDQTLETGEYTWTSFSLLRNAITNSGYIETADVKEFLKPIESKLQRKSVQAGINFMPYPPEPKK